MDGLISCFALVSIIFLDPIIGFTLFGVFNSLRISMTFPLVSRYVDPSKISVANALLKSIDNFIGCFLAYCTGYLYTLFGNYEAVMKLILVICIIGLLFSIKLVFFETINSPSFVKTPTIPSLVITDLKEVVQNALCVRSSSSADAATNFN